MNRPDGLVIDGEETPSGRPAGLVIDGEAKAGPPPGLVIDKPVPSAIEQYTKAAGQLIAHATLTAAAAAQHGIDYLAMKLPQVNADPFGKADIGGAVTEAQKKLQLPEDAPVRDVDTGKGDSYPLGLDTVSLNGKKYRFGNIEKTGGSPGIVKRLTDAAHDTAIQFGIKPTQEEQVENPTIAALGITRPMRAYQTLIDRMLPEVSRLEPWFALKEKPLTDKIDAIINKRNDQSKLDIASIAPVETSTKELPLFDLATRAAAETGQQIIHGALSGLPKLAMNPVDLVEAESAGRLIGAGFKGAGEAISRSAPELALRAQLSPVSRIAESDLAHITKAPEDLTMMDHVHRHVQGVTNTILEDIQKRTGASAADMQIVADELDKAGYQKVFRKLNGMRTGEMVPSEKLRSLMARAPDAPDSPAGLLEASTREGGAVQPRPMPTSPHDVAVDVASAGVLSKEAQAVAHSYPHLFSAASDPAVYWGLNKSARDEMDGMMAEMVQNGVKPGSVIDMIKEGMTTGKASFIKLSKLNDSLYQSALQDQGAHSQTIGRHSADAYTASQRPGETLVVGQMEVAAQKAAVTARAQATQDVWDEAHKALQEAEMPPEQPAAPPAAAAPSETPPAAIEPVPLPGRAEALAHAEEAGVPIDHAAEIHRAEALKAQESGTLDPAIAQEYAEAGDDSFDPAALEAASYPFPHPRPISEMTADEIEAEYPGMEKATYQSLVDDAKWEAEKSQRAEAKENMESAGIKAQPAHDILRKTPISMAAIKKLGLQGEFKSFKGITTKKGGVSVDTGGMGDNKGAVRLLIDAGVLPEGASVNDMLDLLDHESRKGTKAEAEASMVRDEGDSTVRDQGFSDDAQGFLFDDQGRTNPDAIEANPTPRPEPKAEAAQEGLPLASAPEGERKPLIEKPSAKPDVKATGEITDVGQELWYNRRNLIGKGLKWDDIRDLNSTLKTLEVQKTKVWPRPDYEAMVEGGMHPITAHLVKQVFDSIAIKPEVSGVPKDDDMETYIAEVQRVKDETFKWAKIVEKMKNEKPYTTGTILGASDESKLWPFVNFHERGGMTLYGMDQVDERAVRLIDRLYPTKGASSMRFRDNEDYLRKVRLLGGNRFIRALQFDRGSQLDAQKAVKAGWPEPQEAWIKRFRIEKYPKGTEIHTSGIGYGKLEKDQFFVQNRGGGFWKKGSIVSKGFDTQAEAEVAAKDMAKKTAKRQESAEKNLTEAQRNGPVYRPAGLDVTPKSLQEKFGFRGVNFGNYTDQAERQAFTNRSYDALNDLAEVVGIPPQAISLNGTLGLAYGAQGRGGKNAAAAHFVPGVNEINLTKDNGGGTLAHEWAHALDHYFAVQAGDVLAKSPEPFITHHIDTYNADGKLSALRPEIVQAFKDISHAINKTMETPEKVQARMEATKKQAVARLESWANFFGSQIENASIIEDKPSVMRELDALVDRLRAGDLGEGFEQIGRTKGPQNQIHSTTGEIRRFLADKMGRAPDPSNLKALDFAAHLLKRTGEAEWAEKNSQAFEQQSSFVTEAHKLEGGKGGNKNYWTKETEMFARAFQSYILDKLADAERRSDYLTYPQGPAELYQKIEGGDRYPRGVEREKINAAFDTLVNSLKTKETDQGMMIYDAPASAPVFYSKLTRDVEAKMGTSATVEQVKALLRDQKQDEVEWSGINDFLSGKDKVSKTELLDFLRANQLEIQEVMKGVEGGGAQEARARVRIDDTERRFRQGGYILAHADSENVGELDILNANTEKRVPETELPSELRAMLNPYREAHRTVASAQGYDDSGSDAKFGDYTLPGGENYRELLLTLPDESAMALYDKQNGMMHDLHAKYGDGWRNKATPEEFKLVNGLGSRAEKGGTAPFHSSHFYEPNILAHVRYNDRVDAEGKRVLFLEEVQSDWHQKGRREGYTTKETSEVVRELKEAKAARETIEDKILEKTHHIKDPVERSLAAEELLAADKDYQAVEERVLKAVDKFSKLGSDKKYLVPDAPLKKTWHEFALKRMIRMAAENGYDKLAWTTGEQQSERYDLAKQVDAVSALRYDDGTYSVRAKPVGSKHWNVIAQNANQAQLPDLIGKDLASKISNQAKGDIEYSGLDLKVGGEGMKGFYDKIVPSFLNKFGKKFGAQVGETTMEDPSRKQGTFGVHSFPITPALRDVALNEGFSVFDRPSDEHAKAYGPGVDVDRVMKEVQLDLDFGGHTGIPAKLAADGKIDYRGIEINDIQDVAEVIASRRHPKLEHNNFVLLREGKVVSHMVFTSGRPNAVAIEARDFEELKTQMEKTGADTLYTGHNHPSGNPTPSLDDKAVNARLRGMFQEKYKGMLTTDGEEFFHTDSNGVHRPMKFQSPQEKFPVATGPTFTGATSSEEVVAFASKEAMFGKKHTLILQDTRARVIAIEHFDMDANIPAAIKDAVVRHGASRAILVAPKMPSSRLTNLPFEVKDVIAIDKDGKASGYQAYQRSNESAYGPISSMRVADGETPEELPRYLRKDGMDMSDFKAAIEDAKITPGSEVTARARAVPGVKSGTKGVVKAIGQKNPGLMVQFPGSLVPQQVRPEDLVETNRKPAARAALEAAKKSEKVSGEPSMSIKKIIQNSQAGLAAGTPVQMDELQALSEKFKNQAKGVRIGIREGTKAMRAKMDEKIDEFQKKVAGLKDQVKFTAKEAKANADWLAAEQAKIRGEITDYINGALPVEARGKFLNTVKNADTFEKMLFARQSIDDAVGDLHKKGLLADVRKLVPRILDSPGVDVKAKQAIREYLADVELKGRSAATYARLRKTLDFMVGQEAAGLDVDLPKAVIEELDILGRRPLKDMSEAEVEGIFNRLKMLEEIGRTTVKVRESLYLLERERISAEILADLKPIEARQMTQQEGYKPLGKVAEAQNAIKSALNWAQDKYMAITPPDVVWDMMSKTTQYGGAPIKYFAHRIGSNYARAIDGYDGPIQTGRDILDKFNVDQETINRVTAYAYLRQPNGEQYLRNRIGLTDKDIEEAKTLPAVPGAAEWYAHCRAEYDKVYPLLADAVRFNDNQEVGRIPNYWNVRFEEASALDVGEDLASKIRGLHNGFQKNVQMENLKKRQGSNRAVALDGRIAFESYMRLAYYKIAMSRDVRILGEVVNSPEFAEKAGEFGTRFAKQFITLMARRGAPRVGDIIPRLDNARRAGSVFAIVGRLPTALVHMTLLSNAASISGPGPIFGAFKDVMAQDLKKDSSLEDWWRKNDPSYRQQHGDDPVFQDATDVAHWNSKEWWKALTTPTSLRYIVRKATLATLEGNYRQALKKRGIERDLSAPINQDAMNEARLITRRAIPSTDLPHMFLAYNSGDVLTGNLSLNRIVTQFKNFIIDRWSAYSHDAVEMVKQKRYGDAASFAFWQTASDLVEVGIRHGYKFALAAALGAGAANAMDDDDRKFWEELFMKILEKPPFVPDILNAVMYGRVPTATGSLAYDGIIAKPHDMIRAHELGQTRKFYQSMTESLVDMAALGGIPIPFGGTIEQVMRMVMSDGSVRYPYADERERLNNFHKDGTATEDDIQRRALLNHNYAQFERQNKNYKLAVKEGRKQDAAEILSSMTNLAHEAKP